jgi:hypothetical protein
MKVKTVTILGKRWRLRFTPLRKHWGLADANQPHVKSKAIVIDPRHESDRELCDTLIHEITHCAFPEMAEETVAQFATDVTRILHRIGFRLDKAG